MKILLKNNWPLFALLGIYSALFLCSAGNYGVFRDELYYIKCARHLAWGYVDHPPLSLLLLRGVLLSLGDSVLVIRIIPLLCGLACMILTNFFSMNALDLLFWLLAFLLVVLWIQSQNQRLWLLLGLVAGLGLLNKYSMGFWLLCFAIAILLTSYRKVLLKPWPWTGMAIAVFLFIPHLLWQIQHHWPTAEFIHYEPNRSKLQSTGKQRTGSAAAVLCRPLWLARAGNDDFTLLPAITGQPTTGLRRLYLQLRRGCCY
ncbi:hypothetical protein GF407_04005 [candidate division KSB1 bacterium]|nr:hypothetical protein [candidate division KSB1 bacterium]